MITSLEEQFLRCRSERARLLGALVLEKVAAATQTLLVSDSLVPSANLSPDLERGEVGKRRRGVLKKSGTQE